MKEQGTKIKRAERSQEQMAEAQITYRFDTLKKYLDNYIQLPRDKTYSYIEACTKLRQETRGGKHYIRSPLL